MPSLRGTLRVPGDKSISHRALIFSALAEGECLIRGLSPAEDCRSTMACLSQLGLSFKTGQADGAATVESHGLQQLKEPSGALDAGNSGTTMRLLSGLLSGRPFKSVLDGDSSLRARTMTRVSEPLTLMGATIYFKDKPGYAPFEVTGGRLRGIAFETPLASAQVQTCLLLAGLQAEDETSIKVPEAVRDHTLRMFEHIGVPFQREATGKIHVKRLQGAIKPFSVTVPADISSAAFFMVAAACLPGSDVTLLEVGLNPGRRLIIDALQQMGADVQILRQRVICGEPVADIQVRYKDRLNGATIGGASIASGVDEIPILALAGALCRGTFTVTGAGELRHKESDRLAAIVKNLRQAGADIEELPDGFTIRGGSRLTGGSQWHSHEDHRLAMTGLIASLCCKDNLEIDNVACVNISYPTFQADLAKLLQN